MTDTTLQQDNAPPAPDRWEPVYNIQPGVPFADALATGLLQAYGFKPESLANIRILLPTRRACRILRDTFLRITDGKPLMLPAMQALGDIDEDELSLEISGLAGADLELNLPPAIPPLKRQILLARELMQSNEFHYSTDQAFALANALGRLLDQTYTENLDLKNLPSLVKEEGLSDHWQITVKFLEILSQKWPQILNDIGVIDQADRRNRLLLALSDYWQAKPAQTPVIAAGSTGSIPATAMLLKTISRMPKGTVILPGLDPTLDLESRDNIEDTHPQATLYTLLRKMEIEPTSVPLWPYLPKPSILSDIPPTIAEKRMDMRRFLASETMRPAATTDHWQNLHLDEDSRHHLNGSLENLKLITCDTIQEEARVISLILRETLIDQGRTAALITADRMLAQRVAAVCRRWNIELDDSAGLALHQSVCGTFLRLTADYFADSPAMGTLLSILKHSHSRLQMQADEKAITLGGLERDFLRGAVRLKSHDDILPARKDRDGLPKQPEQDYKDLAETFKTLCAPLASLDPHQRHSFKDILTAHIQLCENLATPSGGLDETGNPLWRDDDGETAAIFMADLMSHSHTMPDVTLSEYAKILESLMKAVTIRSPYGTHPRLHILGQLEARLINADTIIMGGLNEGSWPPESPNDMWMSRPMRKDFGLPSPERSVGLASHDFVQAFCHRNVIMTRALRNDGAPTRPARWLQRLETVLKALGIDMKDACSHEIYRDWEQQLDHYTGEPIQIKRPEPKPPVNARPDTLYVTAIEKWMRDPYSIYARYILGLRKLDDIEQPMGAAERGNMLHSVLEAFVDKYPRELPANAEEKFLKIARETLADDIEDDVLKNFWWPRIIRAGQWFVDYERQWRSKASPCIQEAEGSYTLDASSSGMNFTIKAKADRIDQMHDGSAAIIDYKSGTVPSQKNIEKGISPQMPLEGVILEQGGFAGINANTVGYIGHWKLSGGAEPGEEKPVKGDYETLLTNTEQGLAKLIRVFANENTPYYSLPRPDRAPPKEFQDYAHLARVQEWMTQDDTEDSYD